MLTPSLDGIVKSRIYQFSWIPACAGMTKNPKIANSYKDRHTREGGYPDFRTTFYEFINLELSAISLHLSPLTFRL
jgi:hypothetical protein